MYVIQHFQADPEVQTLLLSGSIAHGVAKPTPDVDIMLITSDEAYAQRQQKGDYNFLVKNFVPILKGM